MSRKPRLSELDHLELVKYIYYYQKVHGSSPSIREIGKHLHLKSHSAVQRRIQMLVELGYVERRPGKSRGLRVNRRGVMAFRSNEKQLKETEAKWRNRMTTDL